MKRVQDYLRDLDRKKLVDAYFDYAPDGNDGLFKLGEFTKDQCEYIKCRDMSNYIQYLVDMDITDVENGKTYILLAHPGYLVTNENTDVMHKLVCKEALLENEDESKDYWYETSPHPEMLGLYVADTPYTQKHIYELMAQVLYKSLQYGFNQERLAEEFSALPEPFGAWYKHERRYFEELQEKAMEKVPEPSEETSREDIEQLQQRIKAVFAIDDYRRFCYRRELKKLREML